MNKKRILFSAAALIFVALLAWLFIASSKPLPGEKALQDGRKHIPEGFKVDYKFNPPTSGDHYPSWIKKGFYEEPRNDGNLVHSEEHGYVIIWYDCERKAQVMENVILSKAKDIFFTSFRMTTAYAQRTGMTQGSEGSPSASLESMPESFRNGSCDNLKGQLKDIYQKYGPHKIIVVPRVGMDAPIILTAWGRMEKLNSVDQNKIKEFIDAYRDVGPEQTNEP